MFQVPNRKANPLPVSPKGNRSRAAVAAVGALGHVSDGSLPRAVLHEPAAAAVVVAAAGAVPEVVAAGAVEVARAVAAAAKAEAVSAPARAVADRVKVARLRDALAHPVVRGVRRTQPIRRTRAVSTVPDRLAPLN